MTRRRRPRAPRLDLEELVRAHLHTVRELPDFVTFAEADRFVGDGGPGLYPRQRTIGRLIYCEIDHMTPYDREVVDSWRKGFDLGPDRWGVPYDIWDRVERLKAEGRPHFREVIFLGGRRGGKGHIGALMAAREMYRLILLGDPQAHYGLARGKHLRTLITATNYPQARDNQFADLHSLVTGGSCFREHLVGVSRNHISLATSADVERYAQMGIKDVSVLRQIASVRASAIPSNAPAARGSAANMLVFDEFAHHLVSAGMRTAEEVYRALVPSLDQLGGDGIVYIPTSPWTKASFAYKLVQDALAIDEAGHSVNPDMLVIQLPSWGPYTDWGDLEVTEGRVFLNPPQRYGDDLKRREARNPASFRVEYKSQWAEAEEGYLDPLMVERMFQPFCPIHGAALDVETCASCGTSARVLESTTKGPMHLVYRGHADPGKSQSNFAVAIGHLEPFDAGSGDVVHHVIIDHLRVWRPEDSPDKQIPYTRIEAELAELIDGFPSLKVFTYDQYGAFATVALMRDRLKKVKHRAKVREENFNERTNRERAERFKTALGEGWVHAFLDAIGPDGASLLELELKSLQERSGKVVRQTVGPIQTKDLADCVMVVVSELLKDQLDRGLPRGRLGASRIAAGPGFGPGRGHLERSAPRDRLRALGASRQHNPYGRPVPPDPPTGRPRRVP